MSTREAVGAVKTTNAIDTEELRIKDSRIIHPWQNLQTIDRSENHGLVRAEGTYVYELEGKRYIDAPAGMWCTNVGCEPSAEFGPNRGKNYERVLAPICGETGVKRAVR